MTTTQLEPLPNGELAFLLHAAKRAGERGTAGPADLVLRRWLFAALVVVLAWDAFSVLGNLHGSALQ